MSELLVFIDVDGVLNPDDKALPGFTVRPIAPPGYPVEFQVALNPAHGVLLRQLAAETGGTLVWGTTWSEHATTLIGPHVGLADLPFAPIPRLPSFGEGSLLSVAAWKARYIAKYADGRPFVWFDDEADAASEVDILASGPHLVVHVDPKRGLTEQHVGTAHTWMTRLLEGDSVTRF